MDRENVSISDAARTVGVNRAMAVGSARKAGVRGRGKTGTTGHPGRAEYGRLRAIGVGRRDAAEDWDRGIRKIGNARLYFDGRGGVNYTTG